MEYLDVSVPNGASGKFIELHHSGDLQEAQRLWVRYRRVRTSLADICKKLSMCNEPAWLFHFAKKCHREHRDFEEALRGEVEALERTKKLLEEQTASVCSQMQEIEPSLFQTTYTLSGAPLLCGCESSGFPVKRSRDDVLRRDTIIARHLGLESAELCKLFDLDDIPIPVRWETDLGEPSWAAAYENMRFRRLIHKMISDAKRRLRSP